MNVVAGGFILIIIAWLVQLFFLVRKQKEIQPIFVVTYMLGVFLLVINITVNTGLINARYELGTLIVSALVLLKLVTTAK